MTTEYKGHKSYRGNYTEANLRMASEAGINGSSVNGAYDISRKTLKKKILKKCVHD